MKKQQAKKYPVIGCCGLDCGLCPRHHAEGTSRCPGCCGQDFFNKHPSCSYITCCVKKKGLEACGQCGDFACSKFDSWGTEGPGTDSFITYRRARPNLQRIRNSGIKEFMARQKKKIEFLETVLNKFDDGRSKNLYCLAAALLSESDLRQSLKDAGEKIKEEKVKSGDVKTMAKILRGLLDACARRKNIELKLRHKK